MTLSELLEELKQIDPEESGAAMPCGQARPRKSRWSLLNAG